ncbi:unnamed protein product [Mucor hiemalis]
MPSLTASLQQEDFPVGFAEQTDNYSPTNDDTIFYVEWLDNGSEFPSLTSTANESNLTAGNWELLQRKEINDGDHTLIPVEDDAWSKLTTPGTTQELYSHITEKNASELQPAKRDIQPLWSNISIKKPAKKEEDNEIDEETYQDDLSYELRNVQKSQSTRANRLTNKRKIHDLKTVDIHVEGIFRLATSNLGKTEVTWVPYEKKLPTIEQRKNKTILDTYVDNLANFRVSNKAQALTFSARFTHNVKRYTYKYGAGPSESKRPVFPDIPEFSIHSAIVRQ